MLPSSLNVLVPPQKCLFTGYPFTPAYQIWNLNWEKKKKWRVALKAAVYSISLSQLFNAYGEMSAYLSNASLNLLDKRWWEKLVVELYSSQAAKAKTPLNAFTFIYIHPRIVFCRQTSEHVHSHTNKSSTAVTWAVHQVQQQQRFSFWLQQIEISHQGLSGY